MSVVSIYSTDSYTRERLCTLLAVLGRERSEPIRAEEFSDFAEFIESGRRNPRRILVLAQRGTNSVELMATVMEECPESPTVWLSDLDFALFSYRLGVDHFGFLPATAETLRSALNNCKRKKCMTHMEPNERQIYLSPQRLRDRMRAFFGLKNM